MHELSLMHSLVATIEDNVGDERVTVVRIEVGRLTAALPDALRFCFDVCAQGTKVEGAALEIAEVAGAGRCRTCGGEISVGDPPWQCGCGSADVEVTGGDELRIVELEVI